jgi:hypothetical protein
MTPLAINRVKPINIELRVDELAMHGFEPSDRYRIGEAVQRELSRLFTEQGLPPSLAQGGEVARLDGGTWEAEPASAAEAIGSQVAQAVYRALSW